MQRRRLVRVPATTANLGPGFDAFAAALALHLEVEVVETGAFAVVTDLAVPRDRAHLFPRSAELIARARDLGALGATLSGAGPTVLVWCHLDQTAGVIERLRRETEGWASVQRAPFEATGADVRSL